MSLRVDEGMLRAAGLLPPLLPHFLEHLALQDGCLNSSCDAKGVCRVLRSPSSLSFSTAVHMRRLDGAIMNPLELIFFFTVKADCHICQYLMTAGQPWVTLQLFIDCTSGQGRGQG